MLLYTKLCSSLERPTPSSSPRSILTYIHHLPHVLLIPPFFSHFITLPPSLILPVSSLCFNIHVPSPALVSRSMLCMLNTSSSFPLSPLCFCFLLHAFYFTAHSHPTETSPSLTLLLFLFSSQTMFTL